MNEINVIKRDGTRATVAGETGLSLMQILRDGGVDELLAICGGGCSCATCHVYVHPDYVAQLPGISPDEEDLLSCLRSRRETSRLSCQIQFSDALRNIQIEVAPEE